jgi:hypothetical protein
MPTQRNVFSLVAVLAAIGAVTPATSQEYRGTWEQQMACTPDVWRLCSSEVPDVGRIVGCLQQNTSQLSNRCRAVFESSAEQQQASRVVPQRGPQQMAPRGRAPQPMQQPQAMQPRPYYEPRPFYEDDE